MPNKYTLKLMPQAERDLNEIDDYITFELCNEKAATDLIDAIQAALNGLKDMPRKCPESDIPELKRDGYRKCVVGNYIALYKLDDKEKAVEVARVFYGMRNYKNLDLF
ncbi:hypothetical protein FACS1894211_02750 [Clostridia bacterium]|nr:hypothetical protein FACS1894211_02750 [Clostridia bacterium]